MNGLVSLFVAIGAAVVGAGGFAVWALRRLSRTPQPAMAETQSGPPPPRRAAGGPAAGPSAPVPADAARQILPEAQHAAVRRVEDLQRDNPAAPEAPVEASAPRPDPGSLAPADQGGRPESCAAERAGQCAPPLPLALDNPAPAAARPESCQGAPAAAPPHSRATSTLEPHGHGLEGSGSSAAIAPDSTGAPAERPCASGPWTPNTSFGPTAADSEAAPEGRLEGMSAGAAGVTAEREPDAPPGMPTAAGEAPAEPERGDGPAGAAASDSGSNEGLAADGDGPDEQGEAEAPLCGSRSQEATADAEPGPAVGVPAAEEGGPRASQPLRPRQPAVHRDRRGRRRAVRLANETAGRPSAAAARAPAEAKLRLSLHSIRRTAVLSVVLSRPEGFPERVTLMTDSQPAIRAYDAQRYDDLDLPWTGEFLAGELRIDSAEGFRWLRSTRQVHIFAEDPSEPGLISVGAARAGAVHAVICRAEDAAAVCAAAASAGSPPLTTHEHWRGIPEGWAILSDYRPLHAVSLPLPPGLRPLDPGAATEIAFLGGLAVRPKVFAEGHPPRIEIRALPEGASVMIDGQPAAPAAGGGWEAPGWDVPGRHMVDIVPGPSLAYEIAADPAAAQGWPFWNAHAGRFGEQAASPWALAEICGASVRGPAGQTVLAAETQPVLIALGLRAGAVALQRRGGAPASIAFASEPPAFLLAASGLRRSQGRIIWLGLAEALAGSRTADPGWADAVRMAAARRLPLVGADPAGEQAWRRAKERARRLRRARK